MGRWWRVSWSPGETIPASVVLLLSWSHLYRVSSLDHYQCWFSGLWNDRHSLHPHSSLLVNMVCPLFNLSFFYVRQPEELNCNDSLVLWAASRSCTHPLIFFINHFCSNSVALQASHINEHCWESNKPTAMLFSAKSNWSNHCFHGYNVVTSVAASWCPQIRWNIRASETESVRTYVFFNKHNRYFPCWRVHFIMLYKHSYCFM